MSKFDALLTGATGALGSHVILRLREQGKSFRCLDLREKLATEAFEFDHVIHMAGVNRGSELEVEHGNERLAQDLICYLDSGGIRPKVLTYSNSVKAKSVGSPYAKGKRKAENLLREWCDIHDVEFRNLMLPNLIGEFGRPSRNMVSSTIVHNLVNGVPLPEMSNDEFELSLLDDAAELLVDDPSALVNVKMWHSSANKLATLAGEIFEAMLRGEDFIPSHGLGQKIWSMLVSESFTKEKVKTFGGKSDSRGRFTELFKARSPEQQVSLLEFSPAALRGNHFHRHLVEDFFLVSGQLKVSFGRAWLESPDQQQLTLSEGEAIRFPIGWWHSFLDESELGSKVLVRAQRIFNPEQPDTIQASWPGH